ncbi:MAG: PAS domain-containing sensor histidine kinase [bacterium]|nr:PAS domain-containing sensor histidine kinase [bacterium]
MVESSTSNVDSQRLKSLINSMADGVIAIDSQQKIVMYNGAALNILDSNATIDGQNITNYLKIIDNKKKPVDVKELITATKTPQFFRDYLLPYADGSSINIYLSIAPVHFGYGKKGDKGHIVLLRDITREKSLEEERDEFISVVSHELRTPITIAEGNLSNALYIAKKAGQNENATMLDKAHKQILYLSSIVNDLSTLSRAQRGKLTLDVESVNMHDLVEELEGLYKPQAEQKGLQFVTVIDPKLEMVSSSRLYVKEVAQNFISNAIKYTDTGSISLSAKKTPNGAEINVTDTGIGISKSDQEKVFEKFFRAEDYKTRKQNGTGLGLYVTLKLAKLIHAKITLQSELGKGSTFSIAVTNLDEEHNVD